MQYPRLAPPNFLEACSSLVKEFHRHAHEQSAWLSADVISDPFSPYLRITREVYLDSAQPPYASEASVVTDHEVATTAAGPVDAVEETLIEDLPSDSDDEALPTHLPQPRTFCPQLHESTPHPRSQPDPNPTPTPDALAWTLTYTIHLSPTYSLPTLYIHAPKPPHVLHDLQSSSLASSKPQSVPLTFSTLYTHIIPPAFRAQTSHPAHGVLGGISIADDPVSGAPAFFVHPCRTGEIMEKLGGESKDPGGIGLEQYMVVWIGVVGGCVGLEVPVEVARGVLDGG